MAARKNPGGGKGQDKIWSDAVRRAVMRIQDGAKDKNLERLADELVAQGLAGDVTALKEIGDRLDGKSIQPTDNKHQHIAKVVVEMVSVD